MQRSTFVLAVALLGLTPAYADGSLDVHEPRAVVINITEQDLNRILGNSFRAGGGPAFEGRSAKPSRGVSGLHYRASLSEPTLALSNEGQARLSLDILEADLQIDRFERRIGGRLAFCEGAGMAMQPGGPVGLDLDLQFVIEDEDLRIHAQSLALTETGDEFQLVKPSRCGNTFVPRWLLWQLGKNKLRRKIDRLDDVLLSKARKLAEELNGQPLLNHDVKIRSSSAKKGDKGFRLYPELLDTGQGSLYVSLAFADSVPKPAASPMPESLPASARSSFIAVSGRFLNSLMRLMFSGTPETRHKPGGHFRKVFKSSSIYALIPGLREVESRDDLQVSFRLHAPPEIEFAEQEGSALIRVLLSGIEMDLWNLEGGGETLLGTVAIDSARLMARPFVNVLGGVSFEVLENTWSVSSSGIEFNDEALAATLQEMLFGEAFETTYEPVGKSAFSLGDTDFTPRYFRLSGDYLVIELGNPAGPAPAPLASILPASR